MGVRGTNTKSELSVVQDMDLNPENRQPTPVGMTKEQRVEWLEVTNSYPASYFTPAQIPLLEAHCRHAVGMRHIGELIRRAESEDEIDVVLYDRLLKMQERETRCLASIAVRLGFADSTAREKPNKSKTTGSLNGDNYKF
jgi:hypothetical protein